MARPIERRIKELAAAIAPPGKFARDGGSLNDFLRNVLQSSDTAADASAKILDYFCLDDDRQYNNLTIAVHLCVAVLRDDGCELSEVALKDLRGLLQSHPGYEQIRSWVRANHGI